LGDQRLPVGRIWAIKTGAWLLFAATVCIAFLSIASLAQGEVREEFARDRPIPTTGCVFLVLWPAYGFGIGQFCARAIRKPVVAAVIALLLCPLAAIWWPSLVCGGLSAW